MTYPTAERVTTEQFYFFMCDARFIRTSRLTGLISSEYFYTDVAPEDIDGFIPTVRDRIARFLDEGK